MINVNSNCSLIFKERHMTLSQKMNKIMSDAIPQFGFYNIFSVPLTSLCVCLWWVPSLEQDTLTFSRPADITIWTWLIKQYNYMTKKFTFCSQMVQRANSFHWFFHLNIRNMWFVTILKQTRIIISYIMMSFLKYSMFKTHLHAIKKLRINTMFEWIASFYHVMPPDLQPSFLSAETPTNQTTPIYI